MEPEKEDTGRYDKSDNHAPGDHRGAFRAN